ncbi:hypothetical protein F5880DRAFT_1539597 [Lentinula raphanica]|nr:hypothetical protein F5880DRAFT_1539597 [Lentinula raphanica]
MKSQKNQRVFTISPFSSSVRNRILARLSRLSSTSNFRICAFVSLFLIVLSTCLISTTLAPDSKLVSLLPLPKKLRKPWSTKPSNGVTRIGEGPLVPRFRDSRASTNVPDSNESIYVVSLPHRTDRRMRMEFLREYLGLNWTYVDATYADEEIVTTIMKNVYTLREEAMRARLELHRMRDAKLKSKGQDDDDDHFSVTKYPDDLEDLKTATQTSTTSISFPSQVIESSQIFSGVKLPFQWPVFSNANQSTSFEPYRVSSVSPLPLKNRILEFLDTFDVYLSNTQRTWRTGDELPSTDDDVHEHDYFSQFLTNLGSNLESSVPESSNLPMQLQLVCSTKDFSLIPYSPTLPYHRYLTAARVAVWHSHLRVLREIVEAEKLRPRLDNDQDEFGSASTTVTNSWHTEGESQIRARTSNGARRIEIPAVSRHEAIQEQVIAEETTTNDYSDIEMRQTDNRDKNHEHISIILEDDIDVEKDIRSRLRRIWNVLPNDWDVVFLGHCWSDESFWPALTHPVPTGTPSDDSTTSETQVEDSTDGVWNTLHPSHSPRCTHSYALSPPGARKILAHLEYPPFAYSRAIDQAYAWLVSSGRLKAYSVVGSVVVQVKSGSSPRKGDSEDGEGKGSVSVGDVWRPGSLRNNANQESSKGEVNTSSWDEKLSDGVFSES